MHKLFIKLNFDLKFLRMNFSMAHVEKAKRIYWKSNYKKFEMI